MPSRRAAATLHRAVHQTYYVYILANRRHGTLYVGVTNSLQRRTWQHLQGATDSFTRRYAVRRLVWYETFTDVRNAIARENQLKGGSRAKKIALIEAANPEWEDLAEPLFGKE